MILCDAGVLFCLVYLRQILTLDSDFLFYRISDRDSFDIIQVQ